MADKKSITELQELRIAEKTALDQMTAGLTEHEKILMLTDKTYKSHVKHLKEINNRIKEYVDASKENSENLMQMESRIKGISGLQKSMVSSEQKRLQQMKALNGQNEALSDTMQSIADKNQQLAALSAEDLMARELISEQIRESLAELSKTKGVTTGIVENLTEQFNLASNISSLTSKQQKFLEKQLEVYDSIKDSVGGVLETASLMTKGPAGFFGTVLAGAGIFINKLGEVRKELGGIADAGTTALSFIDHDAVGNTKELAAHMGGINNVSNKLKVSTSLISANMGLAGSEAVGLIGAFTRLNEGSSETAVNLMKSSQEFARQNNIIPSELMKDLASSTEEFALFGKEGGKNMLKAAAAAAKLGVSLKTLTGLSEQLLNFESSLTTEMELGALLGRNLNLDKARSLAYQGDIAGATKETLKSLGGIDAFSKMDYFTKKKTAELLGSSVEELENMVALQQNADTITGKMNAKLNLWSEGWNTFVNTGLGKAVTGLGGALVIVGQMGYGLKTLAGPVKALIGSMGQLIAKMFTAKTLSASLSQAPAFPGANVGRGAGGRFISMKSPVAAAAPAMAGPMKGINSVSKFNATGMLKGAAALLVLAGALWVSAKAFQQFATVDWGSVAMGAGALVVFTAAMFGLGALIAGPGAIIFGAGVVGLLALGAALVVFGSGLGMIGLGMSAITGAFTGVVDTLASLSQINFLPIFGLAGALTVLALALNSVAIAGLLALPILAGVGAFSAIVGGSNGRGTDTELLDEIKGLRADLNAGKIAVYMDGKKLTAAVASQAGKVTSNSYINR